VPVVAGHSGYYDTHALVSGEIHYIIFIVLISADAGYFEN